MGNSLVGFKSNLNLIQSNYINWIVETISQDRERFFFFFKFIFKKNDNNDWNKSAKSVKSPKTK